MRGPVIRLLRQPGSVEAVSASLFRHNQEFLFPWKSHISGLLFYDERSYSYTFPIT